MQEYEKTISIKPYEGGSCVYDSRVFVLYNHWDVDPYIDYHDIEHSISSINGNNTGYVTVLRDDEKRYSITWLNKMLTAIGCNNPVSLTEVEIEPVGLINTHEVGKVQNKVFKKVIQSAINYLESHNNSLATLYTAARILYPHTGFQFFVNDRFLGNIYDFIDYCKNGDKAIDEPPPPELYIRKVYRYTYW